MCTQIYVLYPLILLLSCTVVSADGNESIVGKLEDIRQRAHQILNVTDAYERIEKFPGNVEEIMEMFASFGEWFLDGTLGKCAADRNPGEPCVIEPEDGGDNQTKLEAAHLLQEMKGLRDNFPFASVFRNVDGEIYRDIIFWRTNRIFRHTWNYWDFLAGSVADELLSTTGKPQNDSSAIEQLIEICMEENGWVAEDPPRYGYYESGATYPLQDWAITCALRDMGPNCAFDPHGERGFYSTYADRHGFNGGYSNLCLHNFVVRFNNYSENAYEAFLSQIHKYIFQDISLYGLCISFQEVNATERVRRKAWVKQRVAPLSAELLNARNVFNETTLTTEVVECIVTNVMSKQESATDQLLWKERPSRYNGLIKNIVDDIKREHSNFSSEGTIEGVMYLPYADSENRLHCVLKRPEDDNETLFYEMQNYKGASLLIKWTRRPWPSNVRRARMAFIRSHEAAVWDAIFGDKVNDLCEKVRTSVSDPRLIGQEVERERSEFTAIVAIRCAYEFVWYELGWRYYEAAATTSEYVLLRYSGEYNDACGQLIFLP